MQAIYKFTGKERDSETGLDYFGARYYGSNMGRFTSPDKPFADQHVYDPQSWNLYSYTRNNPIFLVSLRPSNNQSLLTSNGVGVVMKSPSALSWSARSAGAPEVFS